VSAASIVLIPAAVSAQCNYGSCAIPPGYCVVPGDPCFQYNESQGVYFDTDCSDGSVYCEHDICFFYEYLSDNSCPHPPEDYTTGATCYNADIFFCNGQTNCDYICGGDEQCMCGCNEPPGAWNCEGAECYCDHQSPILIDLHGDGVNDHLTSVAGGVLFDLDAHGILERVSWTSPMSGVGFLALDRDGNGTIDDGSELFGTATRKRNGKLASNGFDALAEYDMNGDGKIDKFDDVYPRLRLWVDSNHNGRSENGELLTLRDAGVQAISLIYQDSRHRDQFGNEYRYEGTTILQHGEHMFTRRIFDVFFNVTSNAR